MEYIGGVLENVTSNEDVAELNVFDKYDVIFCGCTPDGYASNVASKIPVEAKCPYYGIKDVDKLLTMYPVIPNNHYIQIQSQIMSCGSFYGYYVVWEDSQALTIRVPLNLEAWTLISTRVTWFKKVCDSLEGKTEDNILHFVNHNPKMFRRTDKQQMARVFNEFQIKTPNRLIHYHRF